MQPQATTELLLELDGEPELEDEYKRDLVQLSRMVVEEIEAHRQMLAAEKRELAANQVDYDIPLDGRVAFVSREEVGTIFKVTLPAAAAVTA